MNYNWEKSDFDTNILGFNVAKIFNTLKINKKNNSYKTIKKLIKELKKNKVIYATYRVNAGDFKTIHELQKNNFIIVDGHISLSINISEIENKRNNNIKEADISNIIELSEISKTVFKNVSRYYNDPLISESNANKVFKEWIRNSLSGLVADKVLVWKENKKILGFITIQKKGQIPLLGVKHTARGKGVGKGLILASLQVLQDWGVKDVIIDTQMTNIAALRLYTSCGFKIINSSLTFRWSSNQ